MISKKAAPPRPPLPAKKKNEQQQQVDDPNAQKKFGPLFSIRYCRDDANESDEEISIVRKKSLPSVECETNDIKTHKSENANTNNGYTPSVNSTPSSTTMLSALTTLLPKSPTLSRRNEISEACNEEPWLETRPQEPEFVFKSSHFEQELGPNASESNNDPKNPSVVKHKDNSVVHSAMSLSSLLKKELDHKAHLGQGNTADESKKSGEHLRSNKGLLASALVDSSRLLMPIGLANLNSNVGTSVKQEEAVTYTNIPLYNMLLVAVVVFLYLMLPSSSFLNGFVFGGILMFFMVFALMWLLTPEMSDEERYKRDVVEHEREMKLLRTLSPMEYFQPGQLNQQHDIEGWFFKASTYNTLEPVDFSDPNQLKPVYVRLSGHIMTFYSPRQEDLPKIKRSSMLGANEHIKFSDSKEYDLAHGGEIELVPGTQLTLKKLWAKKYPIYLKLFESSLETDGDSEGSQSTFVLPSITEEMYLFSPTGRAKEEWYYRIEKVLKPRAHANSVSGIESIFNPQTSFPHYMARLIGADSEATSQAQLTWVNALLGRLFWDVWRSEYWNNKVKNRIQNKISRMKLPPFIRYLKVTAMKLGHALPTIQRAHDLRQDRRGIWVDLDVDYEGGIMLTIETMVNLEYYLKQLTDQGKSDADEVILKFSRDDSTYSDVSSGESDVDEGWDDASMSFKTASELSPSVSSEGSESGAERSDTEVDGERRSVTLSTSSTTEQETQGWAGKVKNSKGKKILNMLEKVAKSKWVQKAAETKVVQRAVEKFSNLPIELGVEVVRLRGTLAANIPPPPSNRLWLGFHSNPLLSLIARPKLGERNVRLTHVTEWIEYKLRNEFKSMFVLPNMEDLTIPIMDSGLSDKFPPS